jgi:predicted metalloprotease
VRIVVATPATVDEHCGRAGLRTGGRVSCWDGYHTMLNLDRWNTGVVPFHADVEVYRQYLVNHEVGHALGHGHEFCTRVGGLAPVMMQQTGGLGTCRANGWPSP